MEKLYYTILIVGMVTVLSLGFVVFKCDGEHRRYLKEQELAIEEFNSKVSDGYSIILDGREISGAEKDLIIDNIKMYMLSYDDNEKEVAVTKKPAIMNGNGAVPFIPIIH